MTIAAVVEFVGQLRNLGLLGAAQMQECQALAATVPEPRRLAGELLQRGWLTSFQVNQLLQHRGADLVLGSYILLERLGEGGMGTVFKARHRFMNRLVALKLIGPDLLGTAEATARFLWEMQVAGQLHHPNIVQAHDGGQAGERYYLIMELVEGNDLARLVKEQGPLSVSRACACVRQAALALQHAHERGLVHRDVKPSNLMLAGDQIKLLDLGLARLLQPGQNGNRTRTGTLLGTADYLAPEQALDPRSVDTRADVYSLGCTFYFLLTGLPPFHGGSDMQKLLWHQHAEPIPIEELRPEVPQGVRGILRRMMAKRPEARYQTPAEVALALQPFCTAALAAGAAPEPLPRLAGSLIEGKASAPEESFQLSVGSSGLPAPAPPAVHEPSASSSPTISPKEEPRRGVLRSLAKAAGLLVLLAAAAVLGNLFLPWEGPHRQVVTAFYPPLEVDTVKGAGNKAPALDYKRKWGEAEEELQKARGELTATLLKAKTAEAERLQTQAREEAAKQDALKVRGQVEALEKRVSQAEEEHRQSMAVLQEQQKKAEAVHNETRAVVKLTNNTDRDIAYEMRCQRWDGTQTSWEKVAGGTIGASGNSHLLYPRGVIWIWVRYEKIPGQQVVKSVRFEQYFHSEPEAELWKTRVAYTFEQEGKEVVLRRAEPK